MKNQKILVILFAMIIFGIIIVSSASNYKSKTDSDVYKSLEKNIKTRVIVKLAEPSLEKGFVIKGVKTDYDIEQEKRQIRERIIGRLDRKNIKHIFEKEIALEVSEKELKSLEGFKEIESIVIDRPIKAFLQDSVPLVNASRTWSVKVSGANITGAGETICIIDTGIDYSHLDLIGKNKTDCNIDCINPASGCVENCSVTDDHGHGTHVAGIAAANGSTKGVAIGVGLVGVKVLNSAGSGSGSDLDAGIDWCIANADTYNISVISMSLGTDCTDTPQYCYNSYCDDVGVEQSTAIRIDNATSRNISVIVATGNDANYTSISSPACIKNATAVGATDKNDNIASSYSNRNNMTDLFAPGSSINSTKRTGGYETRSGTSMATPHAAGAFALVRQFFRMQYSRVPTFLEIQNALNSTGKQINDTSGLGLNFSRINTYAAILSLDIQAPNVTLVSPLNNTSNTTLNQTFSCNATDLQLSNITFYLWNSTDGLVYNESKNISGEANSSTFNVSNLNYISYKWNCLAYDLKNNSAFHSSNYTLSLMYLIVNLTSPSNNLDANQNQSFNCSYTSDSSKALKNATLYIWNSSASLVYNISQTISGLTNATGFSYNFTANGNYSWNCRVFNNNSDSIFADSNYSISYDTVYPVISLPSSSVTATSSTITWNTYENSNFSISYSTNISNLNTNQTNSSFALNHSIALSGLTSSTTYYYNITSCDNAVNCVVNGTYNFTTSEDTPVSSSGSSSGGGGGGGAGSSNTFAAKDSEIKEGYTQQLNKNDKITFNIPAGSSGGGREQHSIIVSEIKGNNATIIITSNPVTITLTIEESRKLNLSSPDYYDLYVKLESIINNKAKITVKNINESIKKYFNPNVSVEKPANNSLNINEAHEEKEEKMPDTNFLLIIIYALGLLVIIIVIIFIRIIIKKNKTLNKKEKNLKQYKEIFNKHIKPR